MAFDSGLTMDERVTTLYQPDTLLPEQFLDTFRRKLLLEPEKKLMLAMLEDGVACFQKSLLARDGKGKAQFRDAEQWIFHGGESGIFSFELVCESLGLEPNYLRRGLKQWKQRRLAQTAPAPVTQLRPARPRPHRGPAQLGQHGRRLRRAARR